MEFLNVFRVARIAEAKGYRCEPAGKMTGYRFLVRIFDPKGRVIDSPGKRRDWRLHRAKEFLEAQPDPKRRR